jgi:protein associated with RNAse G/E
MYCPSCGKEIPDASAFCLHCGKPLSLPEKKIEYEYHDLVIDVSDTKNKMWVATDTYTTVAARLHFWQSLQATILTGIQDYLDNGWQPMTEVGPGMMNIKHESAAFFGNPPDRYVCVGFTLKLRRPK